MAGILRGFIEKLKLSEDIEDEDDEDYDIEFEKPRISGRTTQRTSSYSVDRSDYIQENTRRAIIKEEKKPKVVKLPTTVKNSGLEVCVMNPKGFDEVEGISEKLLEGSAVALNIEGIDAVEAQRIVDFVFGTMYAIRGKYRQVSRYVLMFSPQNIDLSGESGQDLIDDILEVPIINKDF